ncbi:MAG: hypothetical protein LBQ52_05560 [Helicobacteraceae bacterium]|jgi:hypothetical protein|nr:hypothetical protein [Helicobacteraceae bacterium]
MTTQEYQDDGGKDKVYQEVADAIADSANADIDDFEVDLPLFRNAADAWAWSDDDDDDGDDGDDQGDGNDDETAFVKWIDKSAGYAYAVELTRSDDLLTIELSAGYANNRVGDTIKSIDEIIAAIPSINQTGLTKVRTVYIKPYKNATESELYAFRSWAQGQGFVYNAQTKAACPGIISDDEDDKGKLSSSISGISAECVGEDGNGGKFKFALVSTSDYAPTDADFTAVFGEALNLFENEQPDDGNIVYQYRAQSSSAATTKLREYKLELIAAGFALYSD